MEKHLFKHLLATLLLLTSTMAIAQTFTVDILEYKVTSKTEMTAEVCWAPRDIQEVTIPSTVIHEGNTYHVTSIGNNAFYNHTWLTKIEIPSTVTNIENNAFYNCTSLAEVNLPGSIARINEYSFYNCAALTEINIPEGVIEIGNSAFARCAALTSVTLPKSLKKIVGAFAACGNIATVNISDLAAYCNIDIEYDEEWRNIDHYRGLPLFNFVSSTYNDIYGGYTHTYSAPRDLVLNGEKIVDLVIPADVDRITGHFLGCSAESISFEERDEAAGDCSLTITCNSFAGMTNLKKVTLPDFDVRLGSSTFIGCTSLEEITIGRDYQWAYDRGQYQFQGMCIDEIEIFQGCTHLRKLTAKEGVTRIPDMFGPQFTFEKDYFPNHIMHYDKLPIDTLVIPDLEITTCIQPQTIDYLNEAAWYGSSLDQREGCNVLIAGKPVKEKSGELIIPEGTKRITSGKVSGMDIVKATLPSSLTDIYGGAFADCTQLSEIKIPDNVTYIGKGAFDNTAIYNNCTEKLLYIDKWLVAHKGNLGDVVIEEGTKGIADGLFTYNASLTGVEWPSSITRINELTFSHCTELKKITIPSSVTSIGNYAFWDCTGLKDVHINDLAAWCGISFGDISANPLCYAENLYLNGDLVTELVIPDGVTKIKDYAFAGCSGITSIEIPNSVTNIGNYAFDGCTSLADINLASTIKSIKLNAFENTAWYNNCDEGLIYLSNWLMGYKGYKFEQDSLIVKEGTVGIADEARFYELNYVSLPKSLKHIGENAFESNNCTFTVHAATPPTVSGGPFIYQYSGNTLIVTIGTGVIEAYRQDKNWQAFGTIIASSKIDDFEYRPASGSQNVGVYGYHGKDSCVKIPAKIEFEGERFTVTDIFEETFQGNTTVTDIDIPDCVTKIEGRAFQNCSSLKNINIPSGVKRIEGFTFSSCTEIESISIPESVEYIGNNAFKNCSSLEEINLPKNIERIEEATFYSCSGLKAISIPNSVTEILDNAFHNCTSLTTLDIPNNVKSIGVGAFYGCSSLERVTIGNGTEEIANSAFRLCSNLKTVELDCTEVGTWFNSLSSIEQVVLGKNVQSISRRAFYNAKNTGLTSVTSLIPAENIFAVTDLVKDHSICTLYVQTGTKETYAATTGWDKFANIVEMDLTGIEEIDEDAKDQNEIYDLSGRKVDNPSKGIYIINGKKRLIR